MGILMPQNANVIDSKELKKVDLALARLEYINYTIETRVIEANQTLHYYCALPNSLGIPIGAWVGQVLYGGAYAEMTFSIADLTSDGFFLYIHNTTEPTPNYHGINHGERTLNNITLRIFILYP